MKFNEIAVEFESEPSKEKPHMQKLFFFVCVLHTSGISDAGSESFSGDEDGSLDSTQWLTGLYGGIVLTLPPFFCQ